MAIIQRPDTPFLVPRKLLDENELELFDMGLLCWLYAHGVAEFTVDNLVETFQQDEESLRESLRRIVSGTTHITYTVSPDSVTFRLHIQNDI